MFIIFTAVNLALPTCCGPKKLWNKGFGLATKKSAGMSLNQLSLAGNNFIIPRQGELFG